MSARTSRSASIPVPPARNIETVNLSPLLDTRARLNSGPSRSYLAASADDRRAHIPSAHLAARHTMHHMRSLTDSYSAAAALRTTNASLQLSTTTPSPVFEPRIIRPSSAVAPSRSVTSDPACLPLPPSPRTRRASTANRHYPPPAHARASTGAAPIHALSAGSVAAFPRPAYLEYSALRDLLHTDSPPALPPSRATTAHAPQASLRRLSAFAPYPYLRHDSSMSDSDDDSAASPPPPPSVGLNPAIVSTNPVLRLPTRWNSQDRNPALSVMSADGLDLVFCGVSCAGERDSAAARSNHPIPPACGIYYYEVEISHRSPKGYISIGLASGDVRLTRLPGWEKNSWGYHADDGWVFPGQKDGSPYGPTYETGDIIGCGIDFSQHRMFYTKNGLSLGPVFENVGKHTELFPFVGMRHNTEAVRANFGQMPFRYPIEEHVRAQRNAVWAQIQTTPIDWVHLRAQPDAAAGDEDEEKAPLRRLVLEYLAHHGYARTARALQAQCHGRARRGGTGDEDADAEMEVEMEMEMAEDADAELRTRIEIVNAVLRGDVDAALAETRVQHPAVLEREESLMLFKLRCRKFVELLLDASAAQRREKEGAGRGAGVQEMGTERRAREGMEFVEGMDGWADGADGMDGAGAMEVDDPSHEAHTASPVWVATNAALKYGQALQEDYRGDTRPEIAAHLQRTFGLTAYADPLAAGGGDAALAALAGQEGRVRLAAELNQAILESEGKPAHPTLEMMYRQTGACVVQLGQLGVGTAAFADMQKEFLEGV